MKKFILSLALVVTALICSVGLVACNEKESYNLSAAQTQHGSVILTQTSAKVGEKVRLACMPDLGYRLKGYKVDGNEIDGNTFTMSNKAVEVSANFEIIEYNIEYVLDGGVVADGNPTTYNVESDEITLIAPTKQGFEFGYWYRYFYETEEISYETDDYKVEKIAKGTTGKLTLYARYFNNPHSVNIDENMLGIYIYADNYMAEVGERITLNHAVQNDNYIFLCYTVNGEEIEGDSFVMPNCDVTISAKYDLVEYKITYVLDGGTNSAENPESYTYRDEVIVLRAAEKAGYVFNGWYYLDEGDVINYIDCIYGSNARDYTLYADFYLDESVE